MQNQIEEKISLGAHDSGRKDNLRVYANALTLFRIAIGLPVILALSLQKPDIAWILILLGGFSDFADGALARKSSSTSNWGARLDPLADKILLLGPLIWLASNSIIPIWSVWILITRELIISLWRSNQKEGGPASLGGKIKTTFQFLSVLLMIWPISWGGISLISNLHKLGFYFFWISLILALISAYKYIKIQSKLYPN